MRIDQQLVRQPRRRGRARPARDPGVLPHGASRANGGDALAAHLAEWAPGTPLLVFTNGCGGPVQQRPFATVWASACRRAGLPGWATPHDLRHDFASVLIRSGPSVKVVQARLGHASAKTTLDVYGHLFADEEDRTRAANDNELGPRCAPDVQQAAGRNA